MSVTLLKMVQGILSSMDSDEVNSIGDTVESMQVASTIEQVYNDITTNIELPESFSLFQLNPSVDITKPVIMYIPIQYENIEWVKYNKEGSTAEVTTSHAWNTPDGLTIYFGAEEAQFGGGAVGGNYEQFREIKYLKRKEFLDYIQSLNELNSNVLSYTLNSNGINIPLLCRNDKPPEYYTDFSARTLVFDSYDNSVDDTLQAHKTMAYGKRTHVFQTLDNFVIDLESKYLSIIYNEAKSLCFSEMKQLKHEKAEKTVRRGWIHSQKSKDSIPYGWQETNTLPNYGRRR